MKVVPQVMFYGGCGLICYGAWLIYHPAGIVLAGLAAIACAVGLSIIQDRKQRGK